MVDAATAVKSADRTLALLEYLAAEGAARSLGELADALEIPRSSLHGLVRTMQGRGWLSTDESDAGFRYRIGPQALTVGASYLVTDDIVGRSAGLLDQLSDELGETIHLGVLENSDVLYLAKRDARHNLRLVSGVGVRLPAYATALGKALLAELLPAMLDQTLASPRRRLTAASLVDEDALRRDLTETSARGYAIDDQESTEGVRCFAVVLGGPHPNRHAISCSIPVARLDDAFEQRVIGDLLSAADQFARMTGAV